MKTYPLLLWAAIAMPVFAQNQGGSITQPGAAQISTVNPLSPPLACTASSPLLLYTSGGTQAPYTCGPSGVYIAAPGSSTSTLGASGVGAAGAAGANKLVGPANSIITTDGSGNGSVLPAVSGDGTLNPTTGALAIGKIAGQTPGTLFPLNIPSATPVLKSCGSNFCPSVADTDFQSAVVINPVASFNCVLDGIANNTSCLLAMNTAIRAIQAADTTNSVSFRIQPPTGKPCHFTYTNNRWTWGIKRIFLDMPGCTIQNIISDGVSTASAEKYPLLTGGGAFYEAAITCFTPSCNINSAVDAGDLINTANPSDTSVTLITAGAASKYAIGDWVLVYSYNQSPIVPGLFPPHARYVDWAKVASIASGVITLDRPLTYLHSATYPEDPNYLTQNQSPTGMARVINLKNPVSGIGPTERFVMNGVKVLPNPNTSLTAAQQYFWLNNVINASITNCDFNSFIPEIAMSVIAQNNNIDYTEPDQLVGYLEFDGGYVGSNASAQGVANMKLSGGTYATGIQFNPRVLNVSSVTANGATQSSGNNHGAFDLQFNNAPSRVNIQNSILNGKNQYNDVYVTQPSRKLITLGGAQGATISGNTTVTAPFVVTVTGTLTSGSPNVTAVTNAINIATLNDAVTGTGISSGTQVLSASGTTIVLNKNATTSGTQTLTIFMNPNWKFWGCLEQGGVVSVSPVTDGAPRTGTVQNIYGGTTALTADIKFSGTIPANAQLACNTTPTLTLNGNKYTNWTLEVAGTSNVVPPFPIVPSLNVEDIIQGNGRLHSYRFDTTAMGSAQVLNIFGVIKKLIVDVTQPYTGSDTTSTMRFSVGAGVPAASETVNLSIPGRREINLGETNGAQVGDSLVPLGYYYADSVNIVQINQSGQNPLAGTAAQQALYSVTLETESPYRSNIQ